MKTLITFLVTALLAVNLAACSKKEEAKPAEAASPAVAPAPAEAPKAEEPKAEEKK
jgi:uncharacterized lipoprotein